METLYHFFLKKETTTKDGQAEELCPVAADLRKKTKEKHLWRQTEVDVDGQRDRETLGLNGGAPAALLGQQIICRATDFQGCLVGLASYLSCTCARKCVCVKRLYENCFCLQL